MDVSNASLYEGGTAVSEAAFMAMRVTDRDRKVVILGSVHPEYRQVLETYTRNLATEVVTIPTPQGIADLNQCPRGGRRPDRVRDLPVTRTSSAVWRSRQSCATIAQERGALAVVSFDPISLGVLQRPGDYGADIAVAEGQGWARRCSTADRTSASSPAGRSSSARCPAGSSAKRLTADGTRCYVLGLQTREQHIRREKATSNICTNQGLLALRATVYLSLLGPQGLREVGELCVPQGALRGGQARGHRRRLELAFDRPFFKEFTLQCRDVDGLTQRARAAGFDIGPELSRLGVEPAGGVLVAVTERRTREDIDRLAAARRRVAASPVIPASGGSGCASTGPLASARCESRSPSR